MGLGLVFVQLLCVGVRSLVAPVVAGGRRGGRWCQGVSVPASPATVAEAALASDLTSAVDLTSAERARTCAEQGVAHGAALSTTVRGGGASGGGGAAAGTPFTTYVDYVLDKEGCPVLLLDGARAEHAKNLAASSTCSVLLQARGGSGARGASCARVTVTGTVAPVPRDADDRVVLEASFGVNHPYADDVLGEPGFDLYRLTPDSVFFVSGFGVAATWVPTDDYGDAAADVVAKDAVELCGALNDPKRGADLVSATTQLLGVDDPEAVRVAAVDRLGVDLRVKTKDGKTDEYRLAYRNAASSVEDAKSEINKLLQEAWELDQGLEWDGAYDDKPVVVKRN